MRLAPPYWDIWRHVRLGVNGCWEWQLQLVGRYGRFKRSGQSICAHRFCYELFKGKIPAGMKLDHLCKNTACLNPDHLEVVTSRENTLRGSGPTAQNARKTHCSRGHELNEKNTYRGYRNKRYCRICGCDWAKAKRARLSRERIAAKRQNG